MPVSPLDAASTSSAPAGVQRGLTLGAGGKRGGGLVPTAGGGKIGGGHPLLVPDGLETRGVLVILGDGVRVETLGALGLLGGQVRRGLDHGAHGRQVTALRGAVHGGATPQIGLGPIAARGQDRTRGLGPRVEAGRVQRGAAVLVDEGGVRSATEQGLDHGDIAGHCRGVERGGAHGKGSDGLAAAAGTTLALALALALTLALALGTTSLGGVDSGAALDQFRDLGLVARDHGE